MKHSFKPMLMAATMLALMLTFNSCDDILGEWSRPTPNPVTPSGGGGTATVTSISIDPTLALKVGETGQLTATVDPAGTAVTWSSDQEAIATVDANGLVTAVAMGTAIITAKAGDKTATCKVTVTPGLSTPLTIEAITAGTIKVFNRQSGMKYSKNGAAKTNVGITSISVAAGDKVAFYGTDACYYSTYISGDGDDFKYKVYGNIMSLVDETGFAKNTTLTADNTFQALFSSNAKLTDASGLLLPAMTLTTSCYYEMFYGCANLTAAPKELPAKELKSSCYCQMFYNCNSLTETPKLPATTAKLASNCYYGMFRNCTSLTTAYVKAEYTATGSACTNMFNGCTAAGAKLHTTTANITSWADVMGSGHQWSAWTAVADWND